MNIAEAMRRVALFEARLSSPTDFYARHRTEWLEFARKLTQEVLTHLQPHDANTATWRRHAADVASKVTAELFNGTNETGILFDGSDRDDSPEVVFTDRETGAEEGTGVQVEDIERWVREGRAGVEGGKHLKSIDDGKTDLQIAWRVYRAITNRKGNWQRLQRHIHDFLGSGQETPAVAANQLEQVWLDALVPKMVKDWHDYVAEQVRLLG